MTLRAYELRCSRCRDSVTEVMCVRATPHAETEELCRPCYEKAEAAFAAEIGEAPRPWRPSIRTFSESGNTRTLGGTIAATEVVIGGVRWVQTGPGEWDVDGKTFPGAAPHDTDLAISEVITLRRELHSLCLVVSDVLSGNTDATALRAAYTSAFCVLHPPLSLPEPAAHE